MFIFIEKLSLTLSMYLPRSLTSTLFFFFVARQPRWARASSLSTLHDHTQTHCNWQDSSGRVISPTQRPLSDNTNNTHKKRTSMPRMGFKPAIPAGEKLQTHTLNRAAAGIGKHSICTNQYFLIIHLLFHTSHFRQKSVSPISNSRWILNTVLTSFLSLRKSFFLSIFSFKFLSIFHSPFQQTGNPVS